MNRIQNVGLIINPAAGKGFAANAELARRGLTALGVLRVHTGQGQMGAAALKDMTCELSLYPVRPDPSRLQTLDLAKKLAAQALDAVLVIGGDGTLSDVAMVFCGVRGAPPLLGIGAGSTNAGALITCPGSKIDNLDPGHLEVVPMTGLLASMDGESIGVGFNDCVLGFTVVATIDGQLQDADVGEKLSQRNVPGQPHSIGLPSTQVEKISSYGRQQVAAGESVGTVIIGLAERSFIAKAITGGVCLASFAGLPAGCLVADQALVRVGLSLSQTLALPPIHSVYVSFDEEEQIQVTGVRAGAALCVDGTPLRLLKPNDVVSFQVRREVIRAFKLR